MFGHLRDTRCADAALGPQGALRALHDGLDGDACRRRGAGCGAGCGNASAAPPEPEQDQYEREKLPFDEVDVNDTTDGRRQRILKLWMVSIGAVAAAVVAMLLARDWIVAQWPPAKHLYDLIGVQTREPELTLRFGPAETMRVAGQGGDSLLVRGSLVNASGDPRAAPNVSIALVDAANRRLVETVVAPAAAALPARGAVAFTAALGLPPGAVSLRMEPTSAPPSPEPPAEAGAVESMAIAAIAGRWGSDCVEPDLAVSGRTIAMPEGERRIALAALSQDVLTIAFAEGGHLRLRIREGQWIQPIEVGFSDGGRSHEVREALNRCP